LIRNREFAAISKDDAKLLTSFNEVHLELEGEVYYLYWQKDWLVTQERRDKRNAIVEGLRIRKLRRQEAKAKLAQGIQAKFGMTLEMASRLVDDISKNKTNLPMAQSFGVLLEDEYEAMFDTEIDSLWTSSITF
jgi:hypothetical protein